MLAPNRSTPIRMFALLGLLVLFAGCSDDGAVSGLPVGSGGGQMLTVEGMVTSAVDGEPIEGVTVEQLQIQEDGSEDPGRSTTTDDRGYYRFDSGCYGHYVRVAGNPGWKDSEPVYVEGICYRRRYRWHDFVLEPES